VAIRITSWSSWLAASRNARTTLVFAAVDDFVSALFQSFFGFVSDISIAVSQSGRQGFNGFVAHAAATVLTNLVANFISSFTADSLVAIVQSVDQSSHDFRIASAIVSVAKTIDSFCSLLGVASSL
jgi:hypothetical protein